MKLRTALAVATFALATTAAFPAPPPTTRPASASWPNSPG